MKKRHAFRPTGLDKLEDRVVLSVGAQQLAPLTFRVSGEQARFVVNRIHNEYAAFAGQFRRDYIQAVRNSRIVGEGPALNQLFNVTNQRANALRLRLLNDVGRLPFGRVNLGPSIDADVTRMVGLLFGTPGLEAVGRNAHGTILGAYRATAGQTIQYIRFLNQGGNPTPPPLA